MKRKRILYLLAVAALIAGAAFAGIVPSQNGRVQTVESGTTVNVVGALDVVSGGTLKIAGTAVTATAANLNGIRTGQEYQVGFGAAKAGTTAGWVVAAGNNLYEWTLPASQAGSTLVVPVNGLKVGDTITAYSCQAQIESAGGAVTLDTNLRKLTNAAADPTDASVDTTTQVSVTADTAAAPSKTLGTPDVVAGAERFYILITGTTAASTDIRALGCTVTVTTS